MRKVLGVLCMLLGVAMIFGAGWLIWENHEEETGAQESAALVLQQMTQQMQVEKQAPQTNLQETMPGPDETKDESIPQLAEDAGLLSEPVPQLQATPVPSEMPVMLIDGNEYIGYLEMPTISLSLPVMADWSYPQLRIAPCRYQGSAYDDTMVVMAHNYERHFGYLTSLQIGDPVQFIDAQGNIFRYVVAKHEQLGKYDVQKMVDNDWDLTLFSCTYGGGARTTVRLNRVHAYT